MNRPILTIIAGCNGSGKSSFSYAISSNPKSFDYDLAYKRHYDALFDSEFKETMAHNHTFQELENKINKALNTKSNFTYETNFNSIPLFWPENEIIERYQKGFENLNNHHLFFDSIYLLNTSFYKRSPTLVWSRNNSEETVHSPVPKFLKNLVHFI